jgi:hypothetical protein
MLTSPQIVAAIEFGLSTTPPDSPETKRRIAALIVQLFDCGPSVASSCVESARLALMQHGMRVIPSDPVWREIMANAIVNEATGAVTDWARTVLQRKQGMTSPAWINLTAPLQFIAESGLAPAVPRVEIADEIGEVHPQGCPDIAQAAAIPVGEAATAQELVTQRDAIELEPDEETFEQLCARLGGDAAPELTLDDSVDLDIPATDRASDSSGSTAEPGGIPAGEAASHASEVPSLAPDQDDDRSSATPGLDSSAVDRSIQESLEGELVELDLEADDIGLGTPLQALDVGDDLESELSDGDDDEWLRADR